MPLYCEEDPFDRRFRFLRNPWRIYHSAPRVKIIWNEEQVPQRNQGVKPRRTHPGPSISRIAPMLKDPYAGNYYSMRTKCYNYETRHTRIWRRPHLGDFSVGAPIIGPRLPRSDSHHPPKRSRASSADTHFCRARHNSISILRLAPPTN